MFILGILLIQCKIRRDRPSDTRRSRSTCWPPLLHSIAIVATVGSLIGSFGEAVNCRTKEAVSHYGKSMTSLFPSVAKMEKRARSFDIPITTLTTVVKNIDKIIFHFFLSPHAKTRYSNWHS